MAKWGGEVLETTIIGPKAGPLERVALQERLAKGLCLSV